MKSMTVFCLILLSVYSYSQEVVTGPYFKKDHITYHLNTNVPVSGIIQSFFPNSSQISKRKTYVDGKWHGPSESFHANGQLRSRGNYKDGRQDGLSEGFYENGQLRFRINHIDGKQEGLFEFFDKDGNLTDTVTYENGVEVE